MTSTNPAMKMPELLVIARAFSVGFIGAEVLRVATYLGASFSHSLSGVDPMIVMGVTLLVVLLWLFYAGTRHAHNAAHLMVKSLRFDLLVVVGIGAWIDHLAAPLLSMAPDAIEHSDPLIGGAVLALLCSVPLSGLFQQYVLRPKNVIPQLIFLGDEEITEEADDCLETGPQAKEFAAMVLASRAHSGLVIGIDGPWGAGKTSLINLASRHWDAADDKVIVCRFESLRYASEADLTERLIRDVSAAIQRKLYVPEFRPAASRYSRLIKGKADVSFLGFKLSLEPSQETVEELLEQIDDVLKRVGCRLIMIIDDLDRLDAKTINSVLFATRRTFKLSQAVYVLCYDTDVLLQNKEEGARAREFLEKFVTVKMSLFVDSSKITAFLRRDWQRPENHLGSVPADIMLKLGALLSELADILEGETAAKYLPLVGDLRKVKRFVNAMLLMQLDKSELGRTDFNKRDLINLVLLHLHYPGLFRRIYAEETGDRSGTFSVHIEYGKKEFTNAAGFAAVLESNKDTSAHFLLTQLFDTATLELGDSSSIDDGVLSSRACFNSPSFRTLEAFLQLIVRCTTPEPQQTFVLYQRAVERVLKGEPVASILKHSDFQSPHAHDKFWSLLINQTNGFTRAVAEDAIETLISYLPRYTTIDDAHWGLRHRTTYSLLILLDRAGWGRTSGHRLPNTRENIVEVAWRIFGERAYEGKGILQRLAAEDRGVLGWYDVMLFRLQCSADRQGQLYNLQSALIVCQDPSARTEGQVSDLAILGMRKLSQQVFALFKRAYIDQKRNFLADVNNTSVEEFQGNTSVLSGHSESDQAPQPETLTLAQRVEATRCLVKSFVIYQLSNSFPPKGSGVGCGFYDETGSRDGKGIAGAMNEYMFGICFNPDVHEDNILHFLDHCLAHLSRTAFPTTDENHYIAHESEIPGGLDPFEMGRYWMRHRDRIRQRVQDFGEHQVATPNYVASYGRDLAGVFKVLDGLAGYVTNTNRE